LAKEGAVGMAEMQETGRAGGKAVDMHGTLPDRHQRQSDLTNGSAACLMLQCTISRARVTAYRM